ncbi:MAG TPA: exodeoxyribonuclease VII large subunit, partial [Paludibacter sp.]|nr:exodeoxyribonuclease VII large subunit [Paludibacter sp.]
DMVAHTSLKTPTAVAEFLISNLQQGENQVLDIFSDIRYLVKNKIENEYFFVNQAKTRIKQTLGTWVVQRVHLLDRQKSRLQSTVRMQLLRQNNKLLLLEKNIETHSPIFLLRHGYTISAVNGKRITSVSQVKVGDKISTFVADGEFMSEVRPKDK